MEYFDFEPQTIYFSDKILRKFKTYAHQYAGVSCFQTKIDEPYRVGISGSKYVDPDFWYNLVWRDDFVIPYYKWEFIGIDDAGLWKKEIENMKYNPNKISTEQLFLSIVKVANSIFRNSNDPTRCVLRYDEECYEALVPVTLLSGITKDATDGYLVWENCD